MMSEEIKDIRWRKLVKVLEQIRDELKEVKSALQGKNK